MTNATKGLGKKQKEMNNFTILPVNVNTKFTGKVTYLEYKRNSAGKYALLRILAKDKSLISMCVYDNVLDNIMKKSVKVGDMITGQATAYVGNDGNIYNRMEMLIECKKPKLITKEKIKEVNKKKETKKEVQAKPVESPLVVYVGVGKITNVNNTRGYKYRKSKSDLCFCIKAIGDKSVTYCTAPSYLGLSNFFVKGQEIRFEYTLEGDSIRLINMWSV